MADSPKEKAPAKRQKLVKPKKPAKLRNPVNRVSDDKWDKKNKEHLLLKIIASCWQQFGIGAAQEFLRRKRVGTIRDDCFHAAVDKLALRNVKAEKTFPLLSEFGGTFEEAKSCSYAAGVHAAGIAKKDENTKEYYIDYDIYVLAFDHIKNNPPKPPFKFLRELAGNRKNDGSGEIRGVIC